MVYCSECSVELSREAVTVPATGHTHTGYGVDTETHWSICTCGEAYNEALHNYENGACVCGNIRAILHSEGVTYSVVGQVVTVTHGSACKVGYLMNGKYIAISATANGDGSYSFTAPEGVTEVRIAVTGDVNGDGVLTAEDKNLINNALLGYDGAELTAEAAFAADVNGDGAVKNSDKTRLNAAMLGKIELAWM